MSLFKIILAPLLLAPFALPAAAVEALNAKPESESPWKWSLYSRYRYEDANQYNLVDRKQFSSLRLRPRFTFTGIENLTLTVEPQFNKILGDTALVPTSGTANSVTETSGNSNATGSADSINLRTASLDLSVAETLHLVVGRQALAYGDQVILGASDWGVYGRSFDALRFRYTPAPSFSLDLFQAKIVETFSSAKHNGGDKDLSGLYGSWLSEGVLKTLDLYGFYLQDQRSPSAEPVDATRPWHFGVYGTRFVTGEGVWTWALEAARTFGSENSARFGKNSENDMIDTRVDSLFGEGSGQKLGLQLFRAGPEWRELAPTTFEALGRTDVVGRRNLTGAALHLASTWSKTWSTNADLYYFQRTNADTTAFQPDGSTALGGTTSPGKELGSEADFVAKYAMNPGLSLSGGGGVFFPGAYLKDSLNGKKETPAFLYFMIEARY